MGTNVMDFFGGAEKIFPLGENLAIGCKGLNRVGISPKG